MKNEVTCYPDGAESEYDFSDEWAGHLVLERASFPLHDPNGPSLRVYAHHDNETTVMVDPNQALSFLQCVQDWVETLKEGGHIKS